MDFTGEAQIIGKLRRDLEIREKVFELLKKNKKDEVRKILTENKEVFSYFYQFKTEPDAKGERHPIVIQVYSGRNWDIIYNDYYEDKIKSDLEKLKKEVLDREYLLLQKIYLKQQQDFIVLQKNDLEENRNDRQKINHFTFIVAFGVIVAAIFNMYQIFYQFENSINLHALIISGIFLLIFAIMCIFILTTFHMKKELLDFWSKYTPLIIFVTIILVILILLLISLRNVDIIDTKDIMWNKAITKLDETNSILVQFMNESLKNQNNLNLKLEKIIEKNNTNQTL